MFSSVSVVFGRSDLIAERLRAALLVVCMLTLSPSFPLLTPSPALPGPRSKRTLRQLLNPPEEIESMADSYFQRIYAAEQSIDEVRYTALPPAVSGGKVAIPRSLLARPFVCRGCMYTCATAAVS